MSSLKGMSIADGATSLSVTGGTAQVYNTDGVTVNNGIHLAATAVADFRVRPHLTFRHVPPKRLANGRFSLGVRTMNVTDPVLDSNGEVHYVSTTIERKYDVAVSASTVKSNRYKAAQLLFDADTEDFNVAGSLD